MAYCHILDEEHICLAVKLTPKGKKETVVGVANDAAGMEWLAIKVNAAPVDGQANRALIAFLSKKLKVPKTNISIISGESNRYKKIKIKGDSIELNRLLSDLI